jgi:hypothetical protein
MLVDWLWSSLLLSILLLWLLWHWLQLWPHLQTTTATTARERLLKPRGGCDRHRPSFGPHPPDTLARTKKPARRSQTHSDPGVCLSQSHLSLLSDH